eukprot:CAMPEP_0170572514 /NCGR_PEP_ID=MMETSP0224-20130122/2256_1 /TAXON_ID=285029 /ORGANISM="Togula jolla, Strain CCCM 725" /LENGTH=236 /DNA_ID=CAMNT_0010895007 /DNA_START=339 /DNA_END=1050 /DNA_ORIENTATION=-
MCLWNRRGRCRKGQRCRFAHSPNEIILELKPSVKKDDMNTPEPMRVEHTLALSASPPGSPGSSRTSRMSMGSQVQGPPGLPPPVFGPNTPGRSANSNLFSGATNLGSPVHSDEDMPFRTVDLGVRAHYVANEMPFGSLQFGIRESSAFPLSPEGLGGLALSANKEMPFGLSGLGVHGHYSANSFHMDNLNQASATQHLERGLLPEDMEDIQLQIAALSMTLRSASAGFEQLASQGP